MFGENPDDARYFASKAILALLLCPCDLGWVSARELVARELRLAVELTGHSRTTPEIVRDHLPLLVPERHLQFGRLESQVDDHTARFRLTEGTGQSGCVMQDPADRGALRAWRGAFKLIPQLRERRSSRMRENRINAPQGLWKTELSRQVDRRSGQRRHRDPLHPRRLGNTGRCRHAPNAGLGLPAASILTEKAHLDGPGVRGGESPHRCGGPARNDAGRLCSPKHGMNSQDVSLAARRLGPRRGRAVHAPSNSHEVAAPRSVPQLAGVTTGASNHVDEDQVLGIHCLHASMLPRVLRAQPSLLPSGGRSLADRTCGGRDTTPQTPARGGPRRRSWS